jgi:hypothetical protein
MKTLLFISVFLPFYLLTITVNAGPVNAALTSQAVDAPVCITSSHPFC